MAQQTFDYEKFQMDFNESALSGLKAELLRKKDLCGKIKSTHVVKPLPKKTKIESNNSKEATLVEEEEPTNMLQYSKECLAKKAKLYDSMASDCTKHNSNDDILVNFHKKSAEEETCKTSSDEEFFDDESDWVEYTDFLGRTRKVLKEDLQEALKRNSEFSAALRGDDSNVEENPEQKYTTSKSEHLQKLHEHWDVEMRELENKDDIHYQDVLFNEARSHGVSYYDFSRDRETRLSQQAQLKELRKQSEQLQKEVKERSKMSLRLDSSRLEFSKQRMLKYLQNSLAVTPMEGREVEDSSDSVKLLSSMKQSMEETKDSIIAEATLVLEKSLSDKTVEEKEDNQIDANKVKRDFHIRPWDEGKEGVITNNIKGDNRKWKLMSQEEWIEKKRAERPEQFAPPSCEIASTCPVLVADIPKSTSSLSPKKYPPNNIELCEPVNSVASKSRELDFKSFVSGAQGSNIKPEFKEISQAIDAGLKYLRQKAENRDRSIEKGLLKPDFI